MSQAPGPLYAALLVTRTAEAVAPDGHALYSVVTPGPDEGRHVPFSDIASGRVLFEPDHVRRDHDDALVRFDRWLYDHAHLESAEAFGLTRVAFVDWVDGLDFDETAGHARDPRRNPFARFLAGAGAGPASVTTGRVRAAGRETATPCWAAHFLTNAAVFPKDPLAPADVVRLLGPAARVSGPSGDPSHHHITRVEQYDDDGNVKAVGWLVRVRAAGQRRRRLFSDGKHGGTDRALAAAVEFRNEALATLPQRGDVPKGPVPGFYPHLRDVKGRQVPYLVYSWTETDAEGRGRRRVHGLSVLEHGLDGALALMADHVFAVNAGRLDFPYASADDVVPVLRSLLPDPFEAGPARAPEGADAVLPNGDGAPANGG